MDEPRFKTLSELATAVKSGDIDETKMTVTMDNDCSRVNYGPYPDDDGADWELLYRGKGYDDCEDLWLLAFPTAVVEWC